MANDLEFGVRVNNVGQAVADVGRVKTANEEVGRSVEQSGRAAEQASRRTLNAEQILARSRASAAQQKAADDQRASEQARALARQESLAAQNMQLMQTRLAAVAAGFSQLGSIMGGEAGGVIGQVAHFTSAGISLGSTFGPEGAVVGGILGATIPAMQALYSELTDQAGALHRAEVASGEYARGLLEASRAARTLAASRLEASSQEALTRDAQGIQLASEEAVFLARERARESLAAESRVAADAMRVLEERGAPEAVQARMRERTQVAIAAAQAELERFNTEIGRRSAAAQEIADAQGRTATGQGITPTVPTPHRGGRQEHVLDIYEQEAAAFARASAAAHELEQITQSLQESETERARALDAHKAKAREAADAEYEAAQRAAELERQHTEDLIADANAKAEAQKTLAQASAEASDTFRDSWRGGIDDVIAAWEHANEALRESGQQQLSTAALLEEGMHSTANSIADAVGGTLVGAFQTAVDAWLDGSLTFVEAAEAMVKGVLKSLVSEAIVQGVVELARAVASAASYDMPGAALHLGAAAAWAAVGAAAGAVGAGIGAFGGGASKGGAAAGAALPQATAQDSQRPAGNTVINVYPGGFVTRGEVVAGVYEAINEGGRMGMQLEPSVVGA